MEVKLGGYCENCTFFDQEEIKGILMCSNDAICNRAYVQGRTDGFIETKRRLYEAIYPILSPGFLGPNTNEGDISYYHIAFSNSADGCEDFSTCDCNNRIFVGIYSDACPTDSENPLRYTWTCIRGEKGTSIGDPIGPDES